MSRIVIVSNLLPLKVSEYSQGKITLENRIGGFSSGMKKFQDKQETVWIGTTGFSDKKLTKNEKSRLYMEYLKMDCHPIYLKKKEGNKYLDGFSNSTLWP